MAAKDQFGGHSKMRQVESESSCMTERGSLDGGEARTPSSPVPYTRRIELLSSLRLPDSEEALQRPSSPLQSTGVPRFGDDILRRILSHCSTPTLARCLCISRGMFQLAGWFLYETVDFNIDQLFGGQHNEQSQRMCQTVGWDAADAWQTKRSLLGQARVVYTSVEHAHHPIDTWSTFTALFPRCKILHLLDCRQAIGCDQKDCRFFEGVAVESLVIHVKDSQEKHFNSDSLASPKSNYRAGRAILSSVRAQNLVILVRSPLAKVSDDHIWINSAVVAAEPPAKRSRRAKEKRTKETHLVFLRASPTIPWRGLDSLGEAQPHEPPQARPQALILIVNLMAICRPTCLKVVNLEAFDDPPSMGTEGPPHRPLVEKLMSEELERRRKAIPGPIAAECWTQIPLTYLSLDEYEASMPSGVLPRRL